MNDGNNRALRAGQLLQGGHDALGLERVETYRGKGGREEGEDGCELKNEGRPSTFAYFGTTKTRLTYKLK